MRGWQTCSGAATPFTTPTSPAARCWTTGIANCGHWSHGHIDHSTAQLGRPANAIRPATMDPTMPLDQTPQALYLDLLKKTLSFIMARAAGACGAIQLRAQGDPANVSRCCQP